MGNRRRRVVRHYLVRAQEREQRIRVIKLGGSLKGGMNIVIRNVTIVRRRGTFK